MTQRLDLPSKYGISRDSFKDPYRLAWKEVLQSSLEGPDKGILASLLYLWISMHDLKQKGLKFEYIVKDLHEAPHIQTKSKIKVRSKAERFVYDSLINEGFKVEYEKLFCGGDFPMRPDFYLPEYGVFVEYLGLWDHEDEELREDYRRCFEEKLLQFKKLGLEHCVIDIYQADLKKGIWLEKINQLKDQGNHAAIRKAHATVLNKVRGKLDVLTKLAIQASTALIKHEDHLHKIPKYPSLAQSLVSKLKEMHQEVVRRLMNQNTHEGDSYLLALAHYLHRNPQSVRPALGDIEYLFCDEFQDVYPSLFLLLLPLFEQTHVYAIGDARQSIYGFLGGSPTFMKNMGTFVPGLKKFQLPVNRRSTKSIVQTSEAVLPKGMLKAKPQDLEEHPIHLIYSNDETRDALKIVTLARKIGNSPDVLVLGRVNPGTVPQAQAYADAALKNKGRYATFHKSKGTEASTVVVTGLVKDAPDIRSIPSTMKGNPLVEIIKKVNRGDDSLEEASRLLYVALSRAKKRMFIVAHPDFPSPLLKPLMPFLTVLEIDSQPSN